jgi:biopolymer transport protein ExbD
VDNKVPVKIPSAVYAKVPEDTTDRFEISVQKNGVFFVGKRQVSLPQLKEILRSEIEQNSNLRVQIRADGEVKYKVNEKIMEACADVGASDLIFSAFEE